ncbi:MAG: PIG-L family deacetylase [Flavobacteriales bacterium]|nr:PIG-L family deacetylase [Flavobacteriales bacterium]
MQKIIIIPFLIIACFIHAQQPHQASSAEIFQSIKKLDVLGNVLYLAAHPDDENTRFIAYCANEKLFNTGYLSLTRGDGGQNLIGTEIREELGIIRTQELLAARRTDGGQQFFTRANDFGYSKTPDETLEIWDKQKVLSDVVWVIRKFKPDVIVCRFPPDGRGGHGHHTASALLGMEAFEMAADKTKFPEQLQYVETWQAKRIVMNTGRWWNDKISVNDSGVVAENIGAYNAVLGTSYNEMAAKSRSMHKSQGFGSTGSRGELNEFFEHLKGTPAKKSLFEEVDATWNRVINSKNVQLLTKSLISTYQLSNPEKSIPKLLELRKEVLKLKDDFWKKKKINEIDHLIKACAGLFMEAKANSFSATNGDSVEVEFELIARSVDGLKLKRLVNIQNNKLGEIHQKLVTEELNLPLQINKPTTFKRKFLINDLNSSQPYWLAKQGTLGTYAVDDQFLIGVPENYPAIFFSVDLELETIELNYGTALVYKQNDPVKGETYRPFVVTPPAFLNIEKPVYVFSNYFEKEVEVVIKSQTNNKTGEVKFSVPKGWTVSPSSVKVDLTKKGEEHRIKVKVAPTKTAENGSFVASITIDDKTYSNSLRVIEYDHIPTQTYMPEAKAQLSFISLNKTGNKVGYVVGAGDLVPEALREIGYEVIELTENDLMPEKLKHFQAIVMGIRALNTIDRADFYMKSLLEYVHNGGNLIVQYNTSHQIKAEKFAPFPLKVGRDRVTDEYSEVRFLQPKHNVLNKPNTLTANDFENWTQERGLYFPSEWDSKFDAILSMNDKNEKPKDSALLIAKYGNGNYIYTGISFFRQLPEGVPGAYRLLVNLISLTHE